jgi:hypothetical protein
MSTLATNPSPSPFLPVSFESVRPLGLLEKRAAVLKHVAQSERLVAVRPASRLEVRPKPEMISTGIVELDSLTGGIPRGCLTEICGSASSGKTSVLVATIAAATQRRESCVLIDASDSFDPGSSAAGGMNFSKLLWVRCGKPSSVKNHLAGMPRPSAFFAEEPALSLSKGEAFNFTDDARPTMRSAWTNDSRKPGKSSERRLEQVLKSTDLILQSGGFGLVVLNLAGIPEKFVRRIPLASWFRFQRAVEHTKTALLVISEFPCAQTCAALVMKVCGKPPAVSYQPSAISHRDVRENSSFERMVLGNEEEPCPGRSNELSRMRNPTPEARTSPAPEGRTNLAQRFSAGEVGKTTRSPVGTPEYLHPSHAEVLKEMQIDIKVLRSRLVHNEDRKPMQSVSFTTHAVRAG